MESTFKPSAHWTLTTEQLFEKIDVCMYISKLAKKASSFPFNDLTFKTIPKMSVLFKGIVR